jgi:hypothetical protein
VKGLTKCEGRNNETPKETKFPTFYFTPGCLSTIVIPGTKTKNRKGNLLKQETNAKTNKQKTKKLILGDFKKNLCQRMKRKSHEICIRYKFSYK